MKTVVFALTVTLGVALADPAIAAPYCEGYDAGYNKGYCTAAPAKCNANAPTKPRCPRPHDTESSYDKGFERGAKEGETAATEVRPCDRTPAPRWCSDPRAPNAGSGEDRSSSSALKCERVCTYDIVTGTPSCIMACN